MMWTMLAAGVVLSAQGVVRSTTDVVPIFVTVTDERGQPVSGLTASDFVVKDNGKRQELKLFTNDRQPVTAELLLDLSGSMTNVARYVAVGAREFADALLPGDRVSVGTLQTTEHQFTSNQQAITAAIANVQAGGGSPIWDVIASRVEALKAQPEPRLLVVFTDGADTSYVPEYREDFPELMTGNYPPDRIARAVRDAGIRFEVVVFGNTGPEFDGAVKTGGGTIRRPKTSTQLSATFRQALQELHHAYLLGITPATDGKVHKLDVSVNRHWVTVRSRKTYLAAPSGS